MIPLSTGALARVRGDDHPVLVYGFDRERALCFHSDGSVAWHKLEDITLNPLEIAVRFDQTEQANEYGATEASKLGSLSNDE